jgi:hypothetical protein
MADYALISGNNTAATYAAQVTPAQLWQMTVERFAENNDFWSSMEGASDDSIIITGEDLAAGRGMTMNIRVSSGFYKKPTTGETPMGAESNFEKRKLGEYPLKINVIRHGSSYNELSEQLLGAEGEINSGVPEDLGAWLGRYKSEQMDMTWLHKTNGENFMGVNGKTINTLAAGDGLNWNTVIGAGAYLGRLGGTAARVTKSVKGQAPQLRLSLIASSTALAVLRSSSDYQTKVVNGQARSLSNSIFTGDVPDIDGIAVVERRIVDHDGDGPIGGPQEPRALLGVDVDPLVLVGDLLTVKGGGNPTSAGLLDVDYFRYFDGVAYPFMDGTFSTVTADKKFFLIINPPNAVTDPNKIGMYAYTSGNDGNKIVILERLGTADLGIRKLTVGDVTYNTGVWAGKHTMTHKAGSLIVACNSKGEPIGRSFIVARAAAVRGHGKHRAKRGSETEEDGFFTKVYLRSYFGQSVRKNIRQQCPGILVINHSLHYPDLPLPVTV